MEKSAIGAGSGPSSPDGGGRFIGIALLQCPHDAPVNRLFTIDGCVAAAFAPLPAFYNELARPIASMSAIAPVSPARAKLTLSA